MGHSYIVGLAEKGLSRNEITCLDRSCKTKIKSWSKSCDEHLFEQIMYNPGKKLPLYYPYRKRRAEPSKEGNKNDSSLQIMLHVSV